MVTSQSQTSNVCKTARVRKERKRMSKSHKGCIPGQQLLHNLVLLTPPITVPFSSPPARSLSSSLLEDPSCIQTTHKEPTKVTPTMPKHTRSYHSNSIAMLLIINLRPWPVIVGGFFITVKVALVEVWSIYSYIQYLPLQLVVLTFEFDRLVWDSSGKNVLKQENYKVVGTQEQLLNFQ